jgi:hypothetical protein
VTVEEYKALCLERLSGRAWLDDGHELELFQMFREDYLSSGWNEQDLDTLATLTVLHDLAECVANSEEEAERMREVWRDLPVRDDLNREVIRKHVIEGLVRRLECVDETEMSEDLRPVYRENLAEARRDALAASLDVFPGTPEYDAQMRGDGIDQ